ncbi:MAG: FAD-dependent oxidoreductase [Betaproteobacteria bacterium]|nr:FAD-dependent oxidoreductase [Betaproteobacteria bacterium]NCV69181.1 FAD-dependent oxidoreductase [Betaproteobacteria bacterium]NCY18504.1 FAD-dependent oxidoreductase [Betaproteobacteria bacterium]NDA05001.1 FAD-dependent oxidoreductase [Betaproteobacteria bacterium]NDA20864.1 FAD-dependent oxidoreductase [Betaproteobacteria bacterium]
MSTQTCVQAQAVWQDALTVYVDPAMRTIQALALQGQRRFHILELGFGSGLNLSALIDAWSTHACPDWELYLHSVEPDPPDPDALQAYWHAFAAAGCRLSARCWLERLDPDFAYALPGLHRFKISKGMLFDLHVAKLDEALVRLNACFDLVFMKGFANPHTAGIWRGAVIRAMRKQLAQGALLLGEGFPNGFCDRLSELEFDVRQHRIGLGQRWRLQAQYRPFRRPKVQARSEPIRDLLIIGAGLAGQCMARAASMRGLGVSCIDPKAQQDQQPSAQLPAFLEHLHASPDDNALARLSRAALLSSYRRAAEGSMSLLETRAVGRMLSGSSEAAFLAWQARLLAKDQVSDLPLNPWSALCQRHDASQIFFPRSRAMALPDQLATQPIRAPVAKLFREAKGWVALDEQGVVLAQAGALVLCSPQALCELGFHQGTELQTRPGVSMVIDLRMLASNHPVWSLSTIVSDQHQLVRLDDPARLLVGSLYGNPTDNEAKECLFGAVQRLLGLKADAAYALSQAPASLWRGLRYSAPDHLPMIGALADLPAIGLQFEQLKSNTRLPIPRLEQAYALTALGSRGALWAPFGAEVVLDLMQAIPCPLTADLLWAIDPARGLVRQMRRGIRHNA